MTENEAIKELKSRIELIDKNYKEEAVDYRDVLKKAVAALEEIQQYRTLGTVEEIEEIMQIISEGQDDADESGISTGLLHTLLEYAKYAKIGTVEECREAWEKQMEKKPNIWGDGYDDEGNLIYDMYDCPNCGQSYEIDYEEYKYCPKCGQAIDWEEHDGDLMPLIWEELKKCPFCGSENVRVLRLDVELQEEVCIDDELDEKRIFPYIHCYNCDINFIPDASASTPRDAIKLWNRRCCK